MTLTPAYVRLTDQTLVICVAYVTSRWMINSLLWFPPPGYLKSWRLSTGTSLTSLLELMSWRLSLKRQLQCKKNICMCASHNPHLTPSLLRTASFTAVLKVQHGARSCLQWLPSKISPHNQSELWEMPSSAVSLTPTECVCVGRGSLLNCGFPALSHPTHPRTTFPSRPSQSLPENPSYLVQDFSSVAPFICRRLLMSALDLIKSLL